MLPSIDPLTGNLPPGIHDATWSELAEAFGTTQRRLHLLIGLRAALEALRDAGCHRVYVNASRLPSPTRAISTAAGKPAA